jgi:hypothetical protein
VQLVQTLETNNVFNPINNDFTYKCMSHSFSLNLIIDE